MKRPLQDNTPSRIPEQYLDLGLIRTGLRQLDGHGSGSSVDVGCVHLPHPSRGSYARCNLRGPIQAVHDAYVETCTISLLNDTSVTEKEVKKAGIQYRLALGSAAVGAELRVGRY